MELRFCRFMVLRFCRFMVLRFCRFMMRFSTTGAAVSAGREEAMFKWSMVTELILEHGHRGE